MASSSSSAAASRFTVAEEQFKMFHNIDRIVFTRLIHELHRNPVESMQVIAFWIWLERSGLCRELVNAMLTWSDTLIEVLADESLLLLTFMESEEFPLSLETIDVPLTQCMTQNKVSLNFFHENRLSILHGVTKNVNEVCTRAFEDILLRLVMENNRMVSHGSTENVLGGNEIMKQDVPVIPRPGVMSEQHFQGLGPYAVSFRRNHDVMSNEIGEILSHLQISNNTNSEQEMKGIIPQDERTIFLTFSKGYPISENEIRDYFTRKFGDCVEVIYMQDVPSTEQPLYARLVVYSSSFMEILLEGKSKAKFSINGKHIWARKYVRKIHI